MEHFHDGKWIEGEEEVLNKRKKETRNLSRGMVARK